MKVIERMDDYKRNRFDKRVVFAFLLIVIGGLILASNFQIIPYSIKHYLFSWEMILIVIGVLSLANRQSVLTGVILIGIGSFFMLPDIFHLPYGYHKLFWPVLLIIIGLVLLLRRNSFHGRASSSGKFSTNFIDELNIFGGGERVINSDNFQGGKITCVFGGSSIDLFNAQLAPGNNVIDVFTVFGGTKLIVPSDWDVKVDVIAIFGGFSDKRRNMTRSSESDRRLIIKGIAIFGGGEIKSM